MANLRFDSRPLVLRRAYTATMRATIILPWREQLNHGLHLGLVIASAVIARNVAAQQVLDAVGPQVLGKLYATVALVSGITLVGVGWFARNHDARHVVGLIHMAVATTMGAAFVAPTHNPVGAVIVYVVMEVGAAVLLLAFGIMLGARLGPREARRVAGRVGAGGIIGGLVGGAVLGLGANALGSRTLLLIGAALALVPVFWLPQARETPGGTSSALKRDRNDVPELGRYGWAVAATSLVMVATTTLIDYQFRFVAGQWFDADNMTAFFGLVVSLAGGATVLFQLLVLDKFLDRYGLFVTAAIMPAALILSGGIFGLLPVLETLVLFKLVDSSTNMSVQQATGGLLLAPLGTRARAVWQSRIDGLAKRGGQVLTGLFLAFFPWSPARVLPLTLALCTVWLVALLVTRGRYVRLLTAMLGAPAAREPEVQAYDGQTLRVLEEELATASVARAAVILDLLEQAERRAPDALLQRLADSDTSGDGALLVIDHLTTMRDVEGLKRFANNPNPNVSGAALLALDEVDYSVGERSAREILLRRDVAEALRALAAGLLAEHDPTARKLAVQHSRSAHAPTRLACAHALSRVSPGAPPEIGDILCTLAQDKDPDIARVALSALGKHLSPQACDICLQALHDSSRRGGAMRALAELGPPVVTPLSEHLRKFRDDPSLAAAITWALAQVGSAAGLPPLVETLAAAHPNSRLAAAVALGALHQRRPTVPLPADSIASFYLPEIAAYGLMRDAILSGLPTTPAGTLLRRTLKQRSLASLETLFRLFALRYPEDAVQAAYSTITSPDRSQRQLAIELLDTLLPPEVRQALAGAVGEGSHRRRRREGDELLRQLATGGDRFIKSLAVRVLHEIQNKAADGSEGAPAAEPEEKGIMPSGDIDRILELQSLALFSQASAEDLAEVAGLLVSREVPRDTLLFQEGEPGTQMFIIRAGTVVLSRGGQLIERLGPGEAVGILSVLDRLPRELTATTATHCSLLVMRATDLQQLLADRPLLMHSVFRALTGAIRGQLQKIGLGKKVSD